MFVGAKVSRLRHIRNFNYKFSLKFLPKMQKNNIFIGTNNLTLGTSATNIGLLTYTAGSLVTSGGTFTRWFPTAGLPTSVGTSIGYY